MTIKEAIQMLAGTHGIQILVCQTCKVISIDETVRTMHVVPVNGDSAINDVRLQADIEGENGICIYPEIGTNVVVACGKNEAPFLLASSVISKIKIQCDNIEFNGGTKGMVNISDLVSKINTLEGRMTTHQHTYAGGITTPDPASNPTIQPTIISDIEDPKIKH
jgi:hypothetical protein